MAEEIKKTQFTSIEQLDLQLKKIDELYAQKGTVIVEKPGQWGVHLGEIKSRPQPTESEIKWRNKQLQKQD